MLTAFSHDGSSGQVGMEEWGMCWAGFYNTARKGGGRQEFASAALSWDPHAEGISLRLLNYGQLTLLIMLTAAVTPSPIFGKSY